MAIGLLLLIGLGLSLPIRTAATHICTLGPPDNLDTCAETSWEALNPTYNYVTGTSTVNTTLRGIVTSMGNHTNATGGVTFTFTLDYESNGTQVQAFPWFNFTGVQHKQPSNPLASYTLELIQGEDYIFSMSLCFTYQDCSAIFNPAVYGKQLYFTAPTRDQFYLIVHPLALHIQNLGLPVDPSLMVIGIIMLLAPMIIVTMLSRRVDNDILLPIFLMMVSMNAALRLWPPITIIFITLLSGWMLVDTVTGGVLRVSSPTSQTT